MSPTQNYTLCINTNERGQLSPPLIWQSTGCIMRTSWLRCPPGCHFHFPFFVLRNNLLITDLMIVHNLFEDSAKIKTLAKGTSYYPFKFAIGTSDRPCSISPKVRPTYVPDYLNFGMLRHAFIFFYLDAFGGKRFIINEQNKSRILVPRCCCFYYFFPRLSSARVRQCNAMVFKAFFSFVFGLL